VANAAFSAQQGAVTPPQRSGLGWHVLRVDAINRKPATPIANVRAELVAQVGERKRQDALADLVTKVEDAIGNGASLDEVAQANGLQVRETPAVTATGVIAGAAQGQSLAADLRPLLEPGFEVGPDEDPLVQTMSPTQYAVMKVGRVIPAAPPALPRSRRRSVPT
jgi:peptidyl-prolyl cis-trans isomerase D